MHNKMVTVSDAVGWRRDNRVVKLDPAESESHEMESGRLPIRVGKGDVTATPGRCLDRDNGS